MNVKRSLSALEVAEQPVQHQEQLFCRWHCRYAWLSCVAGCYRAVCISQTNSVQCTYLLQDRDQQFKLLLHTANVFFTTHLRSCFHESTVGAVGFADAAGPGAICMSYITQLEGPYVIPLRPYDS